MRQPSAPNTHPIARSSLNHGSDQTVVISAAARSRQSKERAHRIRVWIAGMAALVFCVAVGIYGFDYYTASPRVATLF